MNLNPFYFLIMLYLPLFIFSQSEVTVDFTEDEITLNGGEDYIYNLSGEQTNKKIIVSFDTTLKLSDFSLINSGTLTQIIIN